jgi:hypothetical protein
MTSSSLSLVMVNHECAARLIYSYHMATGSLRGLQKDYQSQEVKGNQNSPSHSDVKVSPHGGAFQSVHIKHNAGKKSFK